jgi:hypothetical protein
MTKYEVHQKDMIEKFLEETYVQITQGNYDIACEAMSCLNNYIDFDVMSQEQRDMYRTLKSLGL